MSIYPSTKVTPYVYWLTHKITGQFYIGYREANLVPSDQDLPIYKSSSNKIDELGFENFDSQIIAEFLDGDSAYDFENRTIEVNIKNPLCLNKFFMKDGQKKFRRIGPMSLESREKMSTNHYKFASLEHCQNISKGKQGIKPSVETRAKMSKSAIGKILSQKTKDKMSIIRKGKAIGPMSDFHKLNLSIALTGKIGSDEKRAKLSKIHKGRVVTDEAKARQSSARSNLLGINNGIINLMIHKDLIDSYLLQGWIKGRKKS